MNEIKVGDKVRRWDSSYSVVIRNSELCYGGDEPYIGGGKNGAVVPERSKNGTGSEEFNRYVVIATDCKLPVKTKVPLQYRGHNDTILQSIKTGEFWFVQEQLVEPLKCTCSTTCPTCGGRRD